MPGGRTRPGMCVASQLPERNDLRRVLADEIAAILLETRRVRHDVPQRDRLRIRLRDLEVEIPIDVGVEIELPLLDELHDGRPGEQLARRADAKERTLGAHRCAAVYVGVPVALREEELAVLDDGDGRAGDVLVAQVGDHDAVEERLELGAVADAAGRRGGRHDRTDAALFLARGRRERADGGWLRLRE